VHLKKLIKTEPLVPLEKKSKTTILEEKEA
jgi:hypothetical protein